MTITRTRTRAMITIITITRTMAKTMATIMIMIIRMMIIMMMMVMITMIIMMKIMTRTMAKTMTMIIMMAMVVVGGRGRGPPAFAWKITWCPLAAPGILAKARRLQLADASFRDYASFFPFFFVFIVQYSNIVLRNAFCITASTIEYNVSIIHFHIKLDVI